MTEYCRNPNIPLSLLLHLGGDATPKVWQAVDASLSDELELCKEISHDRPKSWNYEV